MNIRQEFTRFLSGEPLNVWRQDQLSQQAAEGHIERITDIYDGLEAAVEQPGDDMPGLGAVSLRQGQAVTNLTYSGDTQDGSGSLVQHVEGTVFKVEQETRFTPDAIDQISRYRSHHGIETKVMHLDRNDPAQSYQAFIRG